MLCYKRDFNSCIICKYNYTFNEEEKICFSKTLPQSEIIMPNTTILQTTQLYTNLLFTPISTFLTNPKSMPTSIKNNISTTLKNIPTTIKNISTNLIHIQESSIFTNPNIKTSLINTPSTMLRTVQISEEATISQSLNSFISSSKISLDTSILESKITNSISTSNIIMKKSNSLSLVLSEISSSSSQVSINISINKLPLSSNEIIISNSISKEELKCTSQEVIEGGCTNLIAKEQIEEIYKYIKENIFKNISNIILESKNVIFQVSSLESQKNNKVNISSIDIGSCEQALKDKENLTNNDELIIFKIDIKNNDSSPTYVQFEIYNLQNMRQLSLDACQNSSIIIKSPIKLDESFDSKFIRLNSSGYNLLNLNDSFYSDICSTYTSENGTDICISGRKTLIFDKNSNMIKKL